MHWVQLTDAWHAFFHAPETCAPQVLFRLMFGGLMLLNAVLLFPLVADFFGADAMWNIAAWQKQQGRSRMCVLHLLPPTTGGFRTLLVIHLLACVGFLIGWQFRICAVVVFVTLVSIHHRNTFILSSGDTVLRLMSFLAMFSSAGDAFPVDAALRGTVGFPAVDPWPLRLMQILISIVYVRTVYWKLRGTMWWNGTAAWYPVWVDTYLRHRPPRWMLSPFFIRIATWGTLLAELALGTLIWIHELRPYVVVAGIVMHAVFEMVMNLQLFGWIMIAGLLLFLPPEMISSWLEWLAAWM